MVIHAWLYSDRLYMVIDRVRASTIYPHNVFSEECKREVSTHNIIINTCQHSSTIVCHVPSYRLWVSLFHRWELKNM